MAEREQYQRETSVVRTTDVSKSFGRNVALRQLNLEFGNGVHGIVGPNGAGKTTLLRLLALLEKPSSGTIEILGEQATRRNRDLYAGSIGYLPQSPRPPRSLATTHLVEYALRLRGHRAAVPDLIAKAVEAVDGQRFATKPLSTLSGGQLQRSFIAAAIAGDPRVILLDEPTSGLDPEQRAHFRALLANLGEEAVVLLSTHLVEDVQLGCDTVTVIADGSRRFAGTIADLLSVTDADSVADARFTSRLEQAYVAVIKGTRQ